MRASETLTYRLDPDLMEAEERRLLTTQLPKVLMINTAGISLVLLMTLRNEPSGMLIAIELGFMGILTCWMIFNSIRHVKKSVRENFASYELEFDESGISMRAASIGKVRVEFADITRIEEVEGFWITVIGKSAKQRIGVPKQLIGYEEVAERLRMYAPFEKKKYPSYRIYAAIPILAVYGVALWSQTPLFVALASIVLWGFLGWAIIYAQRSIAVKQTRRTMWILILPMLGVVPRFLWAVEQLRR